MNEIIKRKMAMIILYFYSIVSPFSFLSWTESKSRSFISSKQNPGKVMKATKKMFMLG